MTEVDLHLEYDQLVAEDPAIVQLVEIAPGSVIGPDDWAALLFQATATFGLDADRVLSTPYGTVPLPRPPAPTADDPRRVWTDVSLQGACPPVLWLPPRIAAQRADEDLDMWAVRLHLELVDRGAWDLDINRPIDAFLVGGLDSSHPDLAEDLVDYLAGQDVGWLNSYQLPPNPVATTQELADAAAEVVHRCRPVYWNLVRDQLEREHAIDAACAQQLRQATVDDVLAELRAAGQKLQQRKNDADAKSQFLRAVHVVLGRIADLDDAHVRVRSVVEFRQSGRTAASADELVRALHEAAQQRHTAIEKELGPALKDPSNETLRALWDRLASMAGAVIETGRRHADELGDIAGGSEKNRTSS